MAFFSNGQNEASSSSGDSGGSGSDSDEKRFYKKIGNSQRQESSSTSTASSDSEPKQVISGPAVEKPAATPSPKKTPEAPLSPQKKPNALDSFAVRNQGTPLEPNPKASSSSKRKRVAAGKGAKDDDAAEEQPEPKKKSASNVKKPVEEETAPLNPGNKKTRKKRQESATVVARATPSSKDSPQKSSKKTAHVWTDSDETVIMHGYLACAKEGLEYPKNIPHLIENIKDLLSYEPSKTQLYEKLRRMKGKYESMKNNMVQGNIKEHELNYKTSHEKELYMLWKKAWGAQSEGDEMEEEPTGDATKVDPAEVVGDNRRRAGKEQVTARDHGKEDEEEEEEVEAEAGTDTVRVPKTPKVLVSNHIPDNDLVSLTPISNGKPEESLGYETFMKETRNMLVKITRDVKEMVEKSAAETRALLHSYLGSINCTGGAGAGGAGRRVNLAVSLRNMEPDLEGVYSFRGTASVDEARVQEMEDKWRELQIREFEVRSQRFTLLKEELSMQIEALKEKSVAELMKLGIAKFGSLPTVRSIQQIPWGDVRRDVIVR